MPTGVSNVPENTGKRVIVLLRNVSTNSDLVMVSGTAMISALGMATSSTRNRRRLARPNFGALLWECGACVNASPSADFGENKRPKNPVRFLCVVSFDCALCAALEDPSISPIFSFHQFGGLTDHMGLRSPYCQVFQFRYLPSMWHLGHVYDHSLIDVKRHVQLNV